MKYSEKETAEHIKSLIDAGMDAEWAEAFLSGRLITLRLGVNASAMAKIIPEMCRMGIMERDTNVSINIPRERMSEFLEKMHELVPKGQFDEGIFKPKAGALIN